MDPPSTSTGKVPCPSCGAQLVWNPVESVLKCGYCGGKKKLEGAKARVLRSDGGEVAEGAVLEHRVAPVVSSRARGGTRSLSRSASVQCSSCGAISDFSSAEAGKLCAFCGSMTLLDQEDVEADALQPEGILPFALDKEAALLAARDWLESCWCVPSRVRHEFVPENMRGIYLPYFTFDASAYATWTAMSGYHYYVTVHYTDSEGHRRSRRERRTKWRPSSGNLRHEFDDTLVCASTGVQKNLIDEAGDFPTITDLHVYRDEFCSGWLVERYQLDLPEAFDEVKEKWEVALHNLCARDVPGDTHRDLRVSPSYSKETFKLVLLPVWLASYKSGKKTYQLVINGHTGTVAGDVPRNWHLLVLVILIIVLIGVVVGVVLVA